MKKIIISLALVMFAAFGCADNPVSAPELSSGYSGKYENLLYNDRTVEPRVTLDMSHSGSALKGTGTYNGIQFSFTGTVEDEHAVITFDLLNTTAGDLRGCVIDGYFGENKTLAGGYTLSSLYGTEKIRFKPVN